MFLRYPYNYQGACFGTPTLKGERLSSAGDDEAKTNMIACHDNNRAVQLLDGGFAL
jgi:hypothetical protein